MAFNEKITREAYYAASSTGERVSFHALMDFERDGTAYHRAITGQEEEPPTRAMQIGTATHALVLDGQDAFSRQFQISDGPLDDNGKPYSKLTKAYKEWAAKQTKLTFSTEEGGVIRAMRNAVLAVDQATGAPSLSARLLAKGRPEVIVRFDYCGLPCQSMVDWINPEFTLESDEDSRAVIVDLKTTGDLDEFVWSAKKGHYVRQLAFYRSALTLTLGIIPDCYIIAVEKAPNPRVGVWTMAAADLDAAAQANEAALGRLREAREKDVWHTGYEELRYLEYRG